MDAVSFLFSPVIWIVSVVCILYWYGTSTFDYFKSQGINGPRPLPYVGNMWGVWKKNIPKYDKEMTAKYGRTFGYFDGTTPNLFTSDIELTL